MDALTDPNHWLGWGAGMALWLAFIGICYMISEWWRGGKGR